VPIPMRRQAAWWAAPKRVDVNVKWVSGTARKRVRRGEYYVIVVSRQES